LVSWNFSGTVLPALNTLAVPRSCAVFHYRQMAHSITAQNMTRWGK
jgi:hypothetical protein